MKIVLYALIVIYMLSAAVQYNDPDPFVWILTYLISAFLCYYKSLGQGDAKMFLCIGLLYFAWGANQFPPQWEGLAVDSVSMKTINVELGRESLGLMMCGIGMLICSIIKKP